MLAPQRSSLVAFLSLLGGLAWWDPARPQAIELELVYLANEGFLVRVGETKLLIDAFVTQPFAGYAALPEELHADLVAGKPPFDGIELALASHFHRDHFQPAPAAEFLSAHQETRLVSSPQVVDDLGRELGDDAAAERLSVLLPERKQMLERLEQGIRVELLRLPHTGGARSAGVQNLGHRIELAGVGLLHVGDADVGTEELAEYELEKRAIDVALVPYWWLGDSQGIAQARRHTGARRLVAVHIPPGEVADVKQRLAALDPEILVFEKPGESRLLSIDR